MTTHTLTALWSTWGKRGPTDEHYHPCFDCDKVVVVGPTRSCLSEEGHQRKRWDGRTKTGWVDEGVQE